MTSLPSLFLMPAPLAFLRLTPGEVFIILLVVLLLFGPKKLPELAKGLGQAIREFRKAAREVEDGVHNLAESKAGSNQQIPPQSPVPQKLPEEPQATATLASANTGPAAVPTETREPASVGGPSGHA